MKKQKHQWRHFKAAEDEFGAEGRYCKRCSVKQYIYGTGRSFYWLPDVDKYCASASHTGS